MHKPSAQHFFHTPSQVGERRVGSKTSAASLTQNISVPPQSGSQAPGKVVRREPPRPGKDEVKSPEPAHRGEENNRRKDPQKP